MPVIRFVLRQPFVPSYIFSARQLRPNASVCQPLQLLQQRSLHWLQHYLQHKFICFELISAVMHIFLMKNPPLISVFCPQWLLIRTLRHLVGLCLDQWSMTPLVYGFYTKPAFVIVTRLRTLYRALRWCLHFADQIHEKNRVCSL